MLLSLMELYHCLPIYWNISELYQIGAEIQIQFLDYSPISLARKILLTFITIPILLLLSEYLTWLTLWGLTPRL